MEGGKKLGKQYDHAITVGVFDIFHRGHQNLLKEMAIRADNITVIVHDDESTFDNKGHFTVQNLEQRLNNIYSILVRMRNRGEIASFDVQTVHHSNPTYGLMETMCLNPETFKTVYVRGNDWQDFPGKQYLEEKGIPIVFIEYTKGISSTQIRESL